MFSKNNLISSKQILKMFITTSIALGILLLLYDYSSVYEGLYIILLTFLISIICVFAYSHIISMKNNTTNCTPPRHTKITHIFYNALLGVKYCFMILIILYLLGFSASNILGIKAHNIIYLISLTLLALYISKSTLEQIARLAELLFFITTIPLVIIIATTISNVSFTTLKNSFAISGLNDFSPIRIIVMAVIFSKILMPIEILKSMSAHLSIKHNSKEKNSAKIIRNSLLISLTFSIATILILYIIITGIFGHVSTKYTVHPFYSLMQMISINTTFEGRMEGIVCISLFTSLLYALSYYFKSFVALFKSLPQNAVSKKIPTIIFIALVIVCAFIIPKSNVNQINLTPEERIVVKNIYIADNGLITIEVFDKEDKTKKYETSFTSLIEVEDGFVSEYNLHLDFSHTNNIIVSDKLFNNTEMLKNHLLDFKKDLRFPENLTIINYNDTGKRISLYRLYV